MTRYNAPPLSSRDVTPHIVISVYSKQTYLYNQKRIKIIKYFVLIYKGV